MVLAGCTPLTPVQVAYTEMTGRVLAQDVVATEDVPPFSNTAVDGYAVRATDAEQVPVELRVVDTLAAGAEPKIAVNAGEAIRIMTGAPMPAGADAVVMVEDTQRVGETNVLISRSAKVHDGVRDAGSDVHAGETVFVPGTVMNAAGVGVLASVNARTVRAFPRARVALLEGQPASIIDQALKTRIFFTAGGAELLATMKANGAYTALVSGGFTAITQPVSQHLGFHEHHANQLLVDHGVVTGQVSDPILGQQAKVEALERLTAQLSITAQDVLAVGDGANDLGMLKRAGSGVALHAKPSVAAQCDIRINHGDLTALLFLQGYPRSAFRTAV